MSHNEPRHFRHSSFRGRIGVARADITPPVGIFARNWGAAKCDNADSIHKPLTLTALTLSPLSPGESLILVEADLGGWRSARAFRSFYSQLLTAFSLKRENLIFAVSHTHAAPPLVDNDDASCCGELLQEWMKQLTILTKQVIGDALTTAVDATLDWHVGKCDLATNRDLPDPNAQNQRFVCGYNPAGATDDTLLVGRVSDLNGRIMATVVNYACHPTTLAWECSAISPDYVGAMRETIQKHTEAPALFLLGACGELAPRYQYVGDPEVADRHGKQLGFAALATLQGMEPPHTELAFAGVVESGAPLAIWKSEPRDSSQSLRGIQTSVELQLKDWPTADELERQRSTCNDRTHEERLRRKCNVRRTVSDSSTFNLPIHVWRIGDAILVGTACEAYSVAQKSLRDRFPDHTVVFMNLINGTIAYLPPADIYETNAYPVWQTPFEPGGLESTIESMTQAIHNALTD